MWVPHILVLQRNQEIYQSLSALLEELRSLPPGTLILVEGSSDKTSLKNLEIRTPIEPIHSSTSLVDILSGFNEVIILTDYDRHGRYLAHKSVTIARSHGVKPNLEFRRRIRRATYKELSHIEGLDTYLRNLTRRKPIR